MAPSMEPIVAMVVAVVEVVGSRTWVNVEKVWYIYVADLVSD